MKKLFLGVVSFGLFIIMVNAFLTMPDLGALNNPAYNATTLYYINNALAQTGASNIVAAIVTDFRAFDTLGETIVLFTSIVAVFVVLASLNIKEEH
jgi:multisubunit Na+/H+ antiporter MnhB subunit